MQINKVVMVILVIIISLGISVGLFFVANKLCIVRNVEMNKDFDVDLSKLYGFLGIENGKYIWEYNIKEMNQKLSRLPYLDQCDVKVKSLDTIEINMKVRVPIARIIISDNKVAFVDKNGVVFRQSNYSKTLPLIIMNKKDDVLLAKNLNNEYIKLINVLNDLRTRYSNIYESISQIDVIDKGRSDIHYIINYCAINKKSYLKNQINVDLIREGLVSSLFLDGVDSTVNTAFYSGIGFVY